MLSAAATKEDVGVWVKANVMLGLCCYAVSWCVWQILGRCIASANSPIDTVHKGVQQWLDLGIPADKLVLGLPWYGE